MAPDWKIRLLFSSSSATDNIFSMLADEVKRDGGDTEVCRQRCETGHIHNMYDNFIVSLFMFSFFPLYQDSDVSAADPNDILKTMKDMGDMDADLFALKKKTSAQTKPFRNEGPKKDFPTLVSNVKPEGAGNSVQSVLLDCFVVIGFTFSPALKFTLIMSPPLDSDEPTTSAKKSNTAPLSTSHKKFTSGMSFLFASLCQYLGGKKMHAPFSSAMYHLRSEPPQRARTRLDEILENLTSPRVVEHPPTGERRDSLQPQDKHPQEKTSGDDLRFGSYLPTVVSMPEGRQSRRQSVRFSTEDVSSSSPEKKPKPVTPALSRHRNSADWLGLKASDDLNFLEGDAKQSKTPAESPTTPSSPLLERRPSLNGSHTLAAPAADNQAPPETIPKQVVSKSQGREEGGDDWLAGALSRKKALTLHAKLNLQQTLGWSHPSDGPPQVTGTLPVSAPNTNYTQSHHFPTNKGSSRASDEAPQQLKLLNPMFASLPGSLWSRFSWRNLKSDPRRESSNLQTISLYRLASSSWRDRYVRNIRTVCLLYFQCFCLTLLCVVAQVKTLQLERDQSQMLLENIQQRHKQDMELIENAHKTRLKLLEESAAHRETQARQECEGLIERLAAVTRSAEQDRSELQAQYQCKLAQAQQDRDREVERLRGLQRKSILEMKKDHEEQVQRLKKLKDEEIDAVTSATSQTRSLMVVIEQMEQFSSRLGELSSRVESTHEHTAHGVEQGTRHRDEQLRVMQDRLAQQQKATAEERAYLKEIISRMDAQLSEQQRQLEKERWKMTAEQAKAESGHRSLEEERRALSMKLNMEREELERAKSALLEEQKSVMEHCAEERRKLAADWAHFHTLEKQRRERSEQEVRNLLERREGSIISLAQEQADLKLHTAELKQKEKAVAQERETLERLREELDREKERISNTALRLKTRAQEVEAFSKLAAEKYEEGERALQEAKRVEAEHTARLKNIHTQTARLRLQEQRILQVCLCNLTRSYLRLCFHFPESVKYQPGFYTYTVSYIPFVFFSPQDREYLQEEQIFLENLKKKSYRSSSFSTE
uniref:Fas-binding factor 1 C-terminal domain-containing protein n=1 Tax=Mola mola TaxID=94237 RepID=A0A3Q4BCC9_MOLML